METNNPFSLQGKTILVTGASSGIGKTVAIECTKIGAQLIITGRNYERLYNTYSQLTQGRHKLLTADLTMDEDIDKLVSSVPKLDGIVHVAGIIRPKPFQFINRKEIEETMSVNFYGPILLTNLLIRQKLISNASSIVFISSISGTISSFIGSSSYSASKGAINGIIKGMALDLAPKKIRVNSIIPGMIDTGVFNKSAISEHDLIEDRKRYPLGRYGKPEDVAYAVIYLLSDASIWVTGTNLLIDGGYTLI